MLELDLFTIIGFIGILSYMTYQCYMLWKEAHNERYKE